MSIIEVKGVPLKFSLVSVVKALAKTINGHFEALNFKVFGKQGKAKTKVCYLRLSEKLDPVRVVEKINSAKFTSKLFNPFAVIPEHIPDIPLATNPRKIPNALRRQLQIPFDDSPGQVLSMANTEIIMEMQYKYPKLHTLSSKMDHKVLEELAMTVNERLQVISKANPETLESGFKLTQAYRRTHPHFGDFQLVLNCLHSLEDAAGITRTQIDEKELSAMPPQPNVIDNLPFTRVQQACQKYSDRINKKITEHIKSFQSEELPTDNAEEVVRKKVREELTKLMPFLPQIVKQVVTKHFIPEKQPFYRIRIYGEPFLPNMETLSPLLRRHGAVRATRATRMYNVTRCNVPPAQLAGLLAMDGSVLNGAKLVIRSSDLPQYKPSICMNSGEEADQLAEPMEVAEEWDENQ